jgi:hypothetical protein
MKYLHADAATGLVHGLRHLPVLPYVLAIGHAGRKGRHPSLPVGRHTTGYDEAGTTSGPFCKISRHASEAAFRFFQSGVHAAHQHPVGQGYEPQVQGFEKVWIFHLRVDLWL